MVWYSQIKSEGKLPWLTNAGPLHTPGRQESTPGHTEGGGWAKLLQLNPTK